MKDWMLNRVIRDEGYSSTTLKSPGQEEITVMVTSRQMEKESDLQAFMDNPRAATECTSIQRLTIGMCGTFGKTGQ